MLLELGDLVFPVPRVSKQGLSNPIEGDQRQLIPRLREKLPIGALAKLPMFRGWDMTD